MPIVHVPADIRELHDGHARVTVEGATIGEVIDQLESRFPGVRGRLVEEHELRPGLVAVVDGDENGRALETKLGTARGIFFVQAISGGALSVMYGEHRA